MSEEAEQQWFFISVVNQEQYGPYTADELEGFVASGSITKETMIWTAALEDQWIPASNVEGLFPPAQSVPPAAVQPAQPAQPVQPVQPVQPARPQLLTGQAAQAVAPLGSAPVSAQPVQPLQAAPLQAVPVQQAATPVQQAAAPAPIQPAAAPLTQATAQRPVKPGMISASMLGTAQPANPVAGQAQTASPAAATMPAVAGQVAPGEPFPAPPPTKASFGMWLSLLVSSPLIMVLAFMLMKSAPALAAILLVAAYLPILGASILSAIYLYRAWKLIQPGGARVTAGKAVGFLFIPFFSLYWMFVAIGGLPAEWNRVMGSHPNLNQAPRLNSGLAMACCIGMFFGIGGFLLIPLLAGICKGINFMGRLHMMPGGGIGGPGGPLGGIPQPMAGARTSPQAQQPGGGIRLY